MLRDSNPLSITTTTTLQTQPHRKPVDPSAQIWCVIFQHITVASFIALKLKRHKNLITHRGTQGNYNQNTVCGTMYENVHSVHNIRVTYDSFPHTHICCLCIYTITVITTTREQLCSQLCSTVQPLTTTRSHE